MEEERIQKFLDLILNEHYCEDCNELCSTGEAFPLEFVAKYIIKLKEENKRLNANLVYRKLQLTECIPISVIQNKKSEIESTFDMGEEWYTKQYIIELLDEILEKGNK